MDLNTNGLCEEKQLTLELPLSIAKKSTVIDTVENYVLTAEYFN